jgi:type II secretory pathway component PulF
MPYFKWYGIDEAGMVQKGSLFARSPELVSKIVQKQHGAEVISCTQHRKRLLHRLSFAERALFFKQLGSLVQAGIRVADALAIAVQSVTNRHFQYVLADCLLAVHEGIALSEACSYHVEFFTPFACNLVRAGEESGALAQACLELASYYETVDTFTAKVRSVLFLPLITVLFFFVIVGAMFWMVIPRFGSLLYSLNKPLPWATEAVIGVSRWLTSLNPLVLLAALCGLVFGVRWLLLRARKSSRAGEWLLYLPFIRLWLTTAATASFCKTLGALLSGGVDIAKALSIATLTVSYAQLRAKYESCARLVEGGTPLSVALEKSGIEILPSCKALLHCGEATGKLGSMLVQCSQQYQERLYKMLDFFAKVVQPLMLLVLGLMIGCLIFVLYEPIFTLSMVAS